MGRDPSWHVEDDSRDVYDRHGRLIANCQLDQREAAKNARLIAAAPDMYEALVSLLATPIPIDEDGRLVDEYKANWSTAWDRARAAIAKATERSEASR